MCLGLEAASFDERATHRLHFAWSLSPPPYSSAAAQQLALRAFPAVDQNPVASGLDASFLGAERIKQKDTAFAPALQQFAEANRRSSKGAS
jgi:hypothetical protein